MQLQTILTFFLGSKHERDLKELVPLVQKIDALEPEVMKYADADFKAKTEEFRRRLSEGESLDMMLPEAFALVREAARRKLGERIFDVQLMGAIILHKGRITEMKTGAVARSVIVFDSLGVQHDVEVTFQKPAGGGYCAVTPAGGSVERSIPRPQ